MEVIPDTLGRGVGVGKRKRGEFLDLKKEEK